jgi:hypothetical protein
VPLTPGQYQISHPKKRHLKHESGTVHVKPKSYMDMYEVIPTTNQRSVAKDPHPLGSRTIGDQLQQPQKQQWCVVDDPQVDISAAIYQ